MPSENELDDAIRVNRIIEAQLRMHQLNGCGFTVDSKPEQKVTRKFIRYKKICAYRHRFFCLFIKVMVDLQRLF
jgi:hypothetical protein